MSVLVLGASTGRPCGVHAHAGLLSGALAGLGFDCDEIWCSPVEPALGARRASFANWAEAAVRARRRDRPRALLVHYSVFAFSHRGLPLFVPKLMAAAGDELPMLCFMHELAYPFGRGGLRGHLWATSQRAALIAVVSRASDLVLTADFRERWVRQQPWLPNRRMRVAPVFSNLPDIGGAVERGGAPRQRTPQSPVIGMFGFAHEGTRRDVVLDALARLNERAAGPPFRLRLIGAPAADSPASRGWLNAAQARGLKASVSATGLLSDGDLAAALAACDLLLFADGPGPTSRKGTLAAALASGRPIVALDGPMTWPALRRERAVQLSAPGAQALARSLRLLWSDPALARALGERGRDFYERHMSLANAAEIVAELLHTMPAALTRGAPGRWASSRRASSR